jgi:sarcosine oxidase
MTSSSTLELSVTRAHYETIIVGLGAMGSAALYQLARRGVRVAGFDRHAPPHPFGSTHGHSRIIREAYYEHPLYVPLVRRAYELWEELEDSWGRTLFRRTGGLMIGPPDGMLVSGARRSAHEHAIPHEELSAAEVSARFPAFCVPESMVALLETRAGVLHPEGCVAAHLALARRAGADIHVGEPVILWRSDGQGVEVETASGRYAADRVAIAAGAWAPELLPELSLPLTVERQVMHWFEPRAEWARFAPEQCPISMIEYAPDRILYTLPDSGEGFKAATHHDGETANANTVRREVAPAEVEQVRALLRQFLPLANGELRASATCLYTNTPDRDFIIDFHPDDARVLLVSPCSGHGFKFASAIGEAVAELLVLGRSTEDLTPFSLKRFIAR